MNRDDLATIQDLTNPLSAAEEDLSSFLFALANIIADELENLGVDIASLRHSSPQDTTQPESRDSDTNSAGVGILVDEQREGILPVESIPLATLSTSMPSGAYPYRDMSFGQHKSVYRIFIHRCKTD
ncbi:hypothetical protein PHLCEN_2v12831 [Hermanssonia centrifuga]|uniref:Uncharacterized protein n=1 Tax=Hermanssonia centrifuga TaxID=98765 RepID=A0A2R6NG04_9APHY|nr:hypothetical protein PHLCEN_2v12831 [Hermanssonia centrifuga]